MDKNKLTTLAATGIKRRRVENNLYDVLGVNRDASQGEIKDAFKKLAMKYHPDSGIGNVDKLHEVKAAYDELSDMRQRKRYDSSLESDETRYPGRVFIGEYFDDKERDTHYRECTFINCKFKGRFHFLNSNFSGTNKFIGESNFDEYSFYSVKQSGSVDEKKDKWIKVQKTEAGYIDNDLCFSHSVSFIVNSAEDLKFMTFVSFEHGCRGYDDEYQNEKELMSMLGSTKLFVLKNGDWKRIPGKKQNGISKFYKQTKMNGKTLKARSYIFENGATINNCTIAGGTNPNDYKNVIIKAENGAVVITNTKFKGSRVFFKIGSEGRIVFDESSWKSAKQANVFGFPRDYKRGLPPENMYRAGVETVFNFITLPNGKDGKLMDNRFNFKLYAEPWMMFGVDTDFFHVATKNNLDVTAPTFYSDLAEAVSKQAAENETRREKGEILDGDIYRENLSRCTKAAHAILDPFIKPVEEAYYKDMALRKEMEARLNEKLDDK